MSLADPLYHGTGRLCKGTVLTYHSHAYLSYRDKLGEVGLQLISLEGLVEALLTLVPVFPIGILDTGCSNQGLKHLEQQSYIVK